MPNLYRRLRYGTPINPSSRRSWSASRERTRSGSVGRDAVSARGAAVTMLARLREGAASAT